ncbi:Tn3 family transposase [Microbulbifer magnicolonia]|uniref:Tn3 family transposase n=1 Tax=Microbulbifer magnicolonia TaxID=3109744 RepID=UPI002B40116C|nr:Tn3 family transposase [Microbulbifer sp. GG15]
MSSKQEHILPPSRQKAWDAPPKLDLRQRSVFTCDSITQRALRKITREDYKVGFLLQVIYFTRKRQFFNVSEFPVEHIRAARKALSLKSTKASFDYPTDVASRHKSKILKQYDWQAFDASFKARFNDLANSLIDKRRRKSDIADCLLEYCLEQHREVPSFTTVRETIQHGYRDYEEKLATEIRTHLSDAQQQVLNNLVSESDEFLLHRDVKRIKQGSQLNHCKLNGRILQKFHDLHTEFLPVISALYLTQEATEDLAIWVKQATTTQLRKFRNQDRRNLHLLAYLQYQHFHRSDAAVDAGKKIVTQLLNHARAYQNRESDKHESEFLDAAAAISNVARNSKELIKKIIDIARSNKLSDREKVRKILKLAESLMLSDIEDVDVTLQAVDTDIIKRRQKFDYYNFIFSRSSSIQKSLGPLLRPLVFESCSSPELLSAITAYQKGLDKISDTTPMKFLTKYERDLICREDEFSAIGKYKALLIIRAFEGFKDESLTLKYSYKYRPTESYFMPSEIWRKSFDEILISTGLNEYRDPEKYLDSIGKTVTELFKTVNHRIDSEENTYVKFNKNGTWSVDTPATDFSTDQFVSQLMGEEASFSLYQIIHQINTYTNFTEELEHRTKRFANEEFMLSHAYAALMSLGTNIGHNHMAKACQEISLKQLRDIESNRFSVNNLKKVNENIVHLIKSLSLPKVYSGDDGRLHTSSDGRKIVVAVDSLMANFSYKYYGKDKGISANAFIDDQQIFFNVNVLTSSEREAPYMLAGIAESKRTLYPETKLKKENHLHSTDTHGYTEAIFAGLHFLGVTFAPRIKSVQGQTLYSYENESLKKNSKFRIGPKTKLNRKLIIKRWDDILRLMASIKMNYVSASDIFRKLSSSSRDTELYRAVKEFGRLLKTHFILTYVDDLELRQVIEKHLSRIELGQGLSRSIFHGRGKRLYVGSKEEIDRVLLCSTILQNIVIAWNYLYLSDYLLSIDDAEQRQSIADGISNGSVISWEHINMLGNFDEQLQGPAFLATLQEMRNIKLRT